MKQLVLLSFLFLSVSIFGKTFELKGVVFDRTNEPLIGATVQVAGTLNGSVVGYDGSFKIDGLEPGEHTVHISFMGYKQHVQIIDVTEAKPLVFVLDEDDQMVGEVVVTGSQLKNTEISARSSEKLSPKVINVVSAKSIELSPDLDVANVVKRISGVTLERSNSGDGQFAVVRGMDKRYNYTMVNGIKIPSPDNKNRYVPLDIFPSDLMDRLEVSKTLTPDMEGDAVGGAINMIMKDAPSKLSVKINGSSGYNMLYSDRDFQSWDKGQNMTQTPKQAFGNSNHSAVGSDFNWNHLVKQGKSFTPNKVFGGTIGNRFLDDKLGVLLAVSYQENFSGSTSDLYQVDVDYTSGDGISGMPNGQPQIDKYYDRDYYQRQLRTGVHNKIDYRFNHRNKISLYNAFVYLRNDQLREMTTTSTNGNSYIPGVLENSERSTRFRSTLQTIYNSTLMGEHELSNWLNLDWRMAYSIATSDQPDNTDFTRVVETIDGVTSPERITGNAVRRRWENNDDVDKAYYLNLATTEFNGNNMDGAFKIGGMYRNKKRTNNFDQYSFRLNPIGADPGYNVRGEGWNEIHDLDWDVATPNGITSDLNYDAHENVGAVYGQFKLEWASKFQVIGGARVEHTDQGYVLRTPTKPAIDKGYDQLSQVYTDVLPSIHLRYKLNKKSNLKASYFNSVIRPGYFEIVPYTIDDELFDEMGNPELERTKADNIDIRYELFPNNTDKILIGAFYKRLDNPIEEAFNTETWAIQPQNFGIATNKGIEIDVIKYFRKFGIKVNYTFTDSEITSDKTWKYRAEDGSLTAPQSIEQKRRLQGQAAHIGNITFMFKDAKRGWDFQLAGNYTGDRIVQVSTEYMMDVWQKEFWQLDLSVEKRFKNGISAFAKVYNLLNTPRIDEIRQPLAEKYTGFPIQGGTGDNIKVREDYYDSQFLIGFRYSF